MVRTSDTNPRIAARTHGSASPFRATAVHASAAILFLLGVGWTVASLRGVLYAGLSLAACLLLALYSNRRIGGYTGDTLGAACELVETATLLVWVAGSSGGQQP
ncbi:MAG: adenosylcobinamide-GDP ribazoletransferase [Planctomycetes bacterium]|nr:adenosylcobinamide-GDP ribazoletransferase [Planctomycetota bacterium]